MRKGSVFAAAAVSAIVLALTLVGCSKGNNPTGPYGTGSGGGGGSGGTAFDSGTLTAPTSFVRAFPTAGVFGYHCRFHVSMGMTGTVTVATGGADEAVVTASGMSFSPAQVTIKPGGQVRWNVTEGTHTVTSN